MGKGNDPNCQLHVPMVAPDEPADEALDPPVRGGWRWRTWTADDDALLGTATDDKVAKSLGVSGATVARRRQLLGIAPYHRNVRAAIDWDAQPLGQDTDKALAARIGAAGWWVVAAERQKRGIKPFQTPCITLTDNEWRQLGLGARFDSEIAKELGCSATTVTNVRNRLKIDRHDPYAATDWDSIPYGTTPDQLLADRFNVPLHMIQLRRQQRNVAAFSGGVLSREGLRLRSVEEAYVDAYLHATGQAHQHEVRGLARTCVADMVLDSGLIIEVAAMAGYPPYDLRLAEKRSIYEEAGLEVWWIDRHEARQLYVDADIAQPLEFVEGGHEAKTCVICGLFLHGVRRHTCSRECDLVRRGAARIERARQAADLVLEQQDLQAGADLLGIKLPSLRKRLREDCTEEQLGRLYAAGVLSRTRGR